MLFGRLEWFNKKNLTEIIMLKSNITCIEEVPLFIKDMLYYIRSLKFDEKPDYKYIINIMINEFNINSFENDNKFEWN